MKIKNKYHIKKRFFVIFCVLSYVGICFGQQFYHIHTINQEIAGYVQEKNDLIREQKNLQQEINLLQNKSYIERIAREDLGLIKPGETLLVPGHPGDMPKAKSVGTVSDNIH
ncbi:FtsB family cell division protein [Candidatus Formimonas warabiya]|uniref:Septum formation initiator family protein n=1 Tax=Formimonas warabiya TaxID=1761012 RepID=A0A3G1KX77_FORW1|nr:septum formation initiator family protein [Candidatus Formimonas warabiya]ATW26997.1 hypothetical protein DCMF_21515 [Candidatus Formimonas warabiya]